jgi:hypothetical protein
MTGRFVKDGPGLFPDEEAVTFNLGDVPYRQITDVPEYWFDDILPGDVVVDIGANIGAFCIRAARKTSRVTALEPVTTALLKENIRINQVNVRVVEGALGDGRPIEICWDGCRVVSPTYPLRKIIGIAGGCDFLKCDCEGAEWLIDPGDLKGIRRIEMELHHPPIGGVPDPALLDYLGRYFDFTIDRKPCHDVLGVMGVMHAERR